MDMQQHRYILYLLPGSVSDHERGVKPIMAQVLDAYLVKYDIQADPATAMKLSRGNVNPSSKSCVAFNVATGKSFYDFLDFCEDVKNTQFLPCIAIGL